MTLVLYYVLFHFKLFQHKQNTSTHILNNHDCNHLFYKWEGVTGEELEDRKKGVIKDVPKYKEKSLRLNQ